MEPNSWERNIGLIVRGTSEVASDYLPTRAQLNGEDCTVEMETRIAFPH